MLTGQVEVTDRRFDPRREQERGRPITPGPRASPTAPSAARIRCAPRLSPRTTHAHPKPLTMRERKKRIVGRAPGERGIDVRSLSPSEREVLRLVRSCVRRRWTTRPPRRTNARAQRAPARSARPRRASRARRRECCRATGSALPPATPSSTITSERLARRPTTSMAAGAGTSSASSTNSTADRRAPPAKVARAHRPRWSSGNKQLVAPPDRRLQGPTPLGPAAGRVAQQR